MDKRSQPTLFQRRYKMSKVCMKRCSISPIIRERQIKTTMRFILHILWWLLSKSEKITSVGEYVEKGNTYIIGENVNWCSHYGKQYGGSSKY